MERKWTKGPWFAVRNSAYWEINPQREYDDYGTPFTVGDVCASDPGDTTGLQEANAHLIAAAPELYEALLALVKADDDENERKAILMASAALAKARGEA